MDFKNSDISTGPIVNDIVGDAAAIASEAAATFAVALQSANILPLSADGQLVLPAGVDLSDIKVVGRDLVIQMPDGTQMIVPDGAIFVPQIVVDGVAIPPTNIAALLLGQEPEPAAGRPQSSGGNFADPVGDIGDPFALGDLLPPTQLAFPEPEEREIIPGLTNDDPDIVIVTPDQPVGSTNATASVQEAALPAREGEPSGSNAGSNGETTTGSFVFDAPDGLASITVNGVAVTSVGQTFVTPLGTLTVTSIASGNIGYSYTLADNTTSPTSTDVFAVVVTDVDGDAASADLVINIVDDAPTARNDTDAIDAGTYGPQTGDVVTGVGTTSGSAGADTEGADGAAVTGVRAGDAGTFGNAGTTIEGLYGTLTLNTDGSYSYVRSPNTPGGVNDVFSYQLTDGDGDTSTATLVISIGDSPATVISVPSSEGGTVVDEAGLPARDTESPGSQAAAPVEVTSGTITFAAPDGVATIQINGTTVTGPGQVILLPTGTFIVTSYDPVGGSLGYTFTLTDNTSGDGTTQVITVTVTDIDGDSDSEPFVIEIIDDAPIARDDSATQSAENAPVTVNVFANDTPGADGVSLSAAVTLVDGSLSGAGTLAYNNDGTFTYAPAPGEAGPVTFQYTITDGDGDPSTATVTIGLLDDSVPALEVSGERSVDEAGLPMRGDEPAGSDSESDRETTTGSIIVATGNDAVGSVVIGGVDVTLGGTVIGAHGTLTVSVSEGTYNYTYTLTDNTSGDATTDEFAIALTDSDGDVATDVLIIAIADDSPFAVNDGDSIAAGTYGPATGNVITDAEEDGGIDVQGADGAAITAISGSAAGTVGGATAGQYGVLTLGADGSYSYVRNAGTPGGVSDIFTYTLTDADGDISVATLKIDIADSVTSLDLPTDGEAGTAVNEAGLPAGSNAAATSEITNGTIAYTAPDGPATVTIDGVAVSSVGQTFVGSFGTLKVTSIADGAIGYQYTLTTNTLGDNTFDDFAVVVTDQDADSTVGNLVIDIVDDVPTARTDVDSVTEDDFSGQNESISADGNVITGVGGADANDTDGVADTRGADGAVVTAVAFGVTPGTVDGATAGAYGSLALNSDGSYVYTLNNFDPAVQGLDGNDTLTEIFTYTITDGDGDERETTLTITINGSDDPITINGLNVEGPDLIVDEDDLPDGSSPDAPALTQSGAFTVNGTDGISSIRIEGVEAFVTQTFSNAYGTFTITSISAPADGNSDSIMIGYSYVLTDNTSHANAGGENFLRELFDVVVTDTDGSSDTATVKVDIIDDVPMAVDDTDTVPGGINAPATGNVITDAAASDDVDTDMGADVEGADKAAVVSVASLNVPANSDSILDGSGNYVVNGEFGVLTIKPDGSYSYVRNDGTPGDRVDVFSYTIRDGDGDIDDATLTITIEDDRPVVGPNPTVAVDDDALAGGNPNSIVGDDADPVNIAGTLSGSGGDGALTWAFQTSVAPGGFQYLSAGSAIVVQQFQGAAWVTVATVTLDTTDGDYTVTQNNPVIHADGGNENNLSVILNYSVTDVDLDSTPGSLTINFDDDAPTATSELTQSVGEGGTIIGSVDFVEGADGASVTHVNDTVLLFGIDGFSQAIDIGNGSITVKADGTYKFTADNPVTGTGSANATFTITDGDKDIVTATAAFTITDVNKPTGGTALAAVDDDGLTGGNAANDVGDLDANDDDNPADTSEATFTGTLGGAVGLDGAGGNGFDFAANTTAIIGLETVTYSLVGNVLTAKITTSPDGTRLNTNLFKVEITDPVTGAYKVTLLDNVLHADGPNNEATDGVASIAYIVTDADGSTAPGTLTIAFDDDAPSLTVSGATMVVEGATATGSWSQTIGADQPGAVTKVVVAGIEHNVDTAINTGNGILTVNAGGTWTFVANSNLNNNLNPAVTFTVKVTDADGDVAQDPHSISITDGADPVSTKNASITVNEEGLANANATGSVVNDSETDSDTVTFQAGSDNITSIAFGSVAGLTADFNGIVGADIAWNRVGDTQITGSIGGILAITINLVLPVLPILTGASGSATVNVTLSDNFPHPNAASENIISLTGLNVVAVDTDGDPAMATVSISVIDDVPLAKAVTSSDTVDEDGLTPFGLAGAEAQNPGDVAGADTVATGSVTTLFTSGADGPLTYSLDAVVSGLPALTSGGTALSYSISGNTLVATIGVGGATAFTFVLNPTTGGWTFTLEARLDHPTGGGENDITLNFGGMINATDADGDKADATGNVTVLIDDDSPVAVDDGRTAIEAGTNPAGATLTGNVLGNDMKGADQPTAIVIAAGTAMASGSVSGATVIGGAFGTLTINPNGSYSYVPNASVASGSEDSFTYRMQDADGDWSEATLKFTFQDDANVPTASAVTAAVDDDGLTGGNSASSTGDLNANFGANGVVGGGDDDLDGAASSEATFRGNLGFTYGLDGAAAAATDFAFTTVNGVVGTENVTYSWNDATGTLTATIASGARATQTLFTVVVNQVTGAYTVSLARNVLHDIGGNENEAFAALNYTVRDSDNSLANGSLTITFDDDSPTAFTPQAASLLNAAGGAVTFQLDAAPGDNIIANNFGADGPGTVRFRASLDGTDSGLKSGGQAIIYDIDNADPTILYGKVGATVIFTINLDPATSQYTVDLDAKVDSLINVQFSDAGYDFLGGNKAWFGIVPNGQDNVPVNDNSQDVLITPLGGSSVNTSGILGGIGTGQDVSTGEGFRIDYVIDLTGSPPNNYTPGVANGHSFDSHWTGGTNGASVSFRQSTGTQLRFQAFDDPDGNAVVGDGGLDTINGIVITYNGIASIFLTPIAAAQTVTLSGRTFTYALDADGKSVLISNIGGGSGNSGPPDTSVAIFTASNYNALEIEHVSGSDIKFSGFGAAIQSSAPVVFQVPVEIVDGDGDAVNGSNLSVTLNPVVPPVVLDLDGDGAEFLDRSAGVTFDYAGDGDADITAWVGADDGLLAIDSNQDGIVNDGSEIVFGSNGLTDLQGIAADYDSNHDGQLTAADDNFALFGVWQDANSNGVTDAGEFTSLVDAGIAEIGLISDGVPYLAAGGDVSVAGQSFYSKTDGTVGIAADAAFTIGATNGTHGRSSEQLRSNSVTSSVVAASLVGLLAGTEAVVARPLDQTEPEPAQFEYRPFVSGFEPFEIARNDQDSNQPHFAAPEEIIQRSGDDSSSLRADDEGDYTNKPTEGRISRDSELLADADEPQPVADASAIFEFGGDAVMHNMLDVVAFGVPVSANDNGSSASAIDDAVRDAMPETMIDRLVDSFSGDGDLVESSSNANADSGDALLGILDQNVGEIHFALVSNTDLSGSHHYDMATSNT